MTVTSAWRANDVVVYDAMRESATTLTALLLASAHVELPTADAAQAEVAELRKAIVTVDGYDRAQVAALTRRISDRIAELSGAAS